MLVVSNSGGVTVNSVMNSNQLDDDACVLAGRPGSSGSALSIQAE
jgi:hypothetical protein